LKQIREFLIIAAIKRAMRILPEMMWRALIFVNLLVKVEFVVK
jgi:hypothetical protein